MGRTLLMRELTVPLPGEHGLSRGMLAHLWAEIRPAQWVKNLTMLAPLLFAQQFFSPSAFARAVFAFALCCGLSSAVSLLNDVLDYERDRVHPEKRYRPLAAGHLTRGTVVGAGGVLLLFVFGRALLLGRPVLFLFVGYWLLNLLYSLWLKHQVILDVFTIAAGFVLRVVAGAFGGLLKEVRHYAHKYMHEVLVDLMYMQQELHPGIFAVMDGTVCGNGAGPRTMVPVVKNYLLASGDQVAIDAIAAKMMGFDPLSIPYLRMCHERELGIADPAHIEVRGEDVSTVNFKFEVSRSLVIWGDQ